MDFDDLGPQPIGSQYTQYPEQANDLGVTEEFYSRTESFRHSHRKPPTAILVEGDIAPPAGGVRELLFIALADESAEELERLERLLLARPSALCVRVHRALHAEEETLAAASLFPSPWSVLVESDFSSASAWRSALLDDAGRAWRETLESGSVGLLASSLIAAAPDHDYLEVA